MKKQNKGITLVALVITIIVLIILAGVSINAVMNGGLITNAKDAKNEYQEGKKEEEISIIDFEVATDFATRVTQGYDENVEGISKNTTYLFKNGYLTGLTVGDKVSTSEKKLPQGYYIFNIDGSAIENKETTPITTGMMIKKGETQETAKEMGRTILFGDVDCNGTVDENDSGDITMFLNTFLEQNDFKDYQIIAIDVNQDSIINYDDRTYILSSMTGGKIVEQDKYAKKVKDLDIKGAEQARAICLEALSKEYEVEWTKWKFDEGDERVSYVIRNAEMGTTTVKNILDKLPVDSAIYREDTDEWFDKGDAEAESQKLQEKDCIYVKYSTHTVSTEIYIVSK